MHYNRLPRSELVGNATADLALLAIHLTGAKESRTMYFYACEPIEMGDGQPGGSVHYTATAFAAFEFHYSQPQTSLDVAKKLLESIPTVQYPAPAEHRVKWNKGWEIRKAVGPHGFIIIALPAWVEP
ncbi:hypothetical protein A2419_03390 [Candidatus Adlerbacteria bacterium RIFOXYC1_FULL_48_26]|uniref:Uncharacterized protein n=1 Tax=Candidatus Adlerbacteria bacterium RIFOXYC1_FULL_48_26 TaxID=1797247 RepID=A0A1F4Y4H4_9BACT|nr:MAG: hypothetical protein A2419_03390 [Candidatus Adlerbacteria bacterium RIFOXYC1_FULL_48_26]OGC94354.1 MAG: hypothetical protein A2389_01180 [Candidatus Adlerbacteria bacterium RIFOXYB1_FULL_48_10]OGC95518.1 MAG: hypothetical protein A2590_00800 [Candidatus Adlerbacteria bacterium RIFOXYD1_FULL_48_8]